VHPLSVIVADGHVDGSPLTSVDGMGATTLRDRVRAELIALDITWSALQKRAQVSQKTIDDLKNGNPDRRWGHTTLSKLDEALGLEPGTLYGIWEQDDASRPSAADVADLRMRTQMLEAKISEIRDRPPWFAEALEVLGGLEPDLRNRVIDFARFLRDRR
jgi:hypothetical protein